MPTATEPAYKARRRLARGAALCARCPVRLRCLADAIANQDEGLRGGILLRNKAVEVSATASAPCGTYAAWRRHRRHNEPSDWACDTARAKYVAEGRRRRAEQAAAA